MHLPTKFHHPMFTRSEVIVLTNKQTPLKTSNAIRYTTTLGKYCSSSFSPDTVHIIMKCCKAGRNRQRSEMFDVRTPLVSVAFLCVIGVAT